MHDRPELAPVLVVGAEPAGLAVALALSALQVRSVLLAPDGLDAGDGWQPEAVAVDAGTRALLARLGAGAATAGARPWRSTRTIVGDRELGRGTAAGGRVSEASDDSPGPLGVAPSAVRSELLRAVRAAERCTVLGGHRLVDLAGDDDGVTVSAIGPDGARTSYRAPYLVAADGAESAVRDLLGIGLAPTDPGAPGGTPYVSTVVRVELAFPRERHRLVDPPWLPGGVVVVEPGEGDDWRIDWRTAAATDPAEPDGRLDAWMRALVGPGVPYELRSVGRALRPGRVAATFSSGRGLLAGAAAHLRYAHGLRDDLQDAENLAWKLACALRGDAGPALLDSYDAERRPAAMAVAAAVAAAEQVVGRLAAAGAWRRRAMLPSAARALRGDAETDPGEPVTYGSSAVLQPGAGAHAPTLPVRGTDGWTGQLSELFGGPLVVLAVGAVQAEAVDLARAVEAALATAPGLPPYRFVGAAAADATSGLEAAGTALGNLLVVRPDGRVSWKVNGEDAPDDVATALARALLRTVGH